MNRFALIAVVAMFALATGSVIGAGCGVQDAYNNERGTGDAPINHTSLEDSPAEIINMPNGYPNLATKCDGHGHRVYTATHTEQRQQIFVIDDPACV